MNDASITIHLRSFHPRDQVVLIGGDTDDSPATTALSQAGGTLHGEFL